MFGHGRSGLAERRNLRLLRIPADTYARPTLSACSAIPIAGGTATLTGVGFSRGVRAVYFAGVAGVDIAVLSDTSMTCTAPAHGAGAVSVQVYGTGGWGQVGGTYV